LQHNVLDLFLLRVIEGIEEMNATYPFLFYGYDWPAFAHIVLAVLFLGAMHDPARNVWVVQFGLIACALIPILAGISIPFRGFRPGGSGLTSPLHPLRQFHCGLLCGIFAMPTDKGNKPPFLALATSRQFLF